MFIAALFTKIKKNWKLPKYSLTVEWINKLLSGHANGYDLTIKNKKNYTQGHV